MTLSNLTAAFDRVLGPRAIRWSWTVASARS